MKAVGLDIGTTTISAVVAGIENGHLERTYTIENNSFVKTKYSWEKIQDPEKIVKKVKRLLDEIIAANHDIQVIGLTGQMHGILYVDKEGKAISPLYTWQDERGNQPCIGERSICSVIKERYGISTYTGYGLVTHLYNANEGLLPEGAYSIRTIMDYLGMVLTESNNSIIHSSNAASLGLYDIRDGVFLEDVITKEKGGNIILPDIIETLSILGTYKEIPVCVAIGDNQASFIGSVKDAKDSILVNMGTGGQISVYIDNYVEVSGLELRPLAKNKYILVGSSLCGGRAYAVLEEFFRQYVEAAGISNINHYEIMEKLAQEGAGKKEKLKVDTRFSGTRQVPEKRGSIANIGTKNFVPDALITGVLEGMAEELYEMYLLVDEKRRKKVHQMIASGNGIRKNVCLQDIISKKFSMVVQMSECSEEAAFGAAKAGMLATKKVSGLELIGIKI